MNDRLLGISSMATRELLRELAEAWQRQGGTPVTFESIGGVDASRRVQEGEPFDVVVLAAEAVTKLVAVGRVVAATQTLLARSDVAIAVARGAPAPAIGSESALREAVLRAATIGISTGPSGQALLALFERWGLSEVLRARVVQARPGVPVGALIARGDVELGFQQLSELMHVEGVDVVGAMPPGLEIVTTFSGGVCSAAARPERARALLDFIRSPAADAARHRHGMVPA
jgi:molybdate transport system substrate-binding protein